MGEGDHREVVDEVRDPAATVADRRRPAIAPITELPVGRDDVIVDDDDRPFPVAALPLPMLPYRDVWYAMAAR